MEKIYANDLHTLLTGEENYPLIGDNTPLPFSRDKKAAGDIQKSFKGLPRYGSCLEKSVIAQELIGGAVCLGSLWVFSAKNGGAYGFDYNLPYEFHAWIKMLDGRIIDFALPGVIERGIILKDEHGPYLEGREPAILAGTPPEWVRYVPVILPVSN
jgi:hypothetical protein